MHSFKLWWFNSNTLIQFSSDAYRERLVSDGCRFFQVSELLKLGGDNYENMKQFSVTVEEKLFRMSAHRDRALTYKTEEVQLTAVDEVYVEQDKSGHVVKHVCRVRVFFLSFLSGKYIL